MIIAIFSMRWFDIDYLNSDCWGGNYVFRSKLYNYGPTHLRLVI
jgi:hypothetical protein